MLDQILELQPVPLNFETLILPQRAQLLQTLADQQSFCPNQLKIVQLLLMLLVVIFNLLVTLLELGDVVVPEKVHLELTLADLADNTLDK